jgi:hypothetical protein
VIIILIDEKLLDIRGEKIMIFGGEIHQATQVIEIIKIENLHYEKIENILYELIQI